ncbi:uncharacterized protein LOC111050829 [Nilaparvata lugens]|uniref:uncharacterized protein LOC111064452 n=1 Tax=Nilaparvata lugens TaxID=108931 RepID=UPI000B97D7BA|nr:uncharacterized protein LOC111064452 [Nilaparvata lugens]XP_039298250.1 uncharacterized protein LOC111050829 [Nilaparvata lugens]
MDDIITNEELYRILNDSEDEDFNMDYDSDNDPAYEPDPDVGAISDSDHDMEDEQLIDTEDDPPEDLVAEVEQINRGQERYVWGPVGDSNMLTNLDYNPNNEDVGVNSDIIETMINCKPKDFLELFMVFVVDMHNES